MRYILDIASSIVALLFIGYTLWLIRRGTFRRQTLLYKQPSASGPKPQVKSATASLPKANKIALPAIEEHNTRDTLLIGLFQSFFPLVVGFGMLADGVHFNNRGNILYAILTFSLLSYGLYRLLRSTYDHVRKLHGKPQANHT